MGRAPRIAQTVAATAQQRAEQLERYVREHSDRPKVL